MVHYVLGDIVTEISERENNPSNSSYERFVGLEHYVSGEVEIDNYGSTSNLNSAMKVFKFGDILVARRNVYLKRASVVYFDGLTSGDSIVLRAKDETIGRILPFILNTDDFWDYADRYSDGTMSKRLSPKVLKQYEFDLPEDNLEQFADTLWAMVDVKKSYQTLLKQTDELVKSQFIEMFGDPDKVILETEYKVSDVADVQVGLVIKPTRFYSDVPTPYPAFRSLNVGSMEVRDSDWIYFTEKGMEENQRTIAHTGDVLVVRSGYPGTSCVVTPEYDGRNVVDLIIAHPDTSKILPEFLCAYTNFPHGKMQIEANQRGVAQKHFNVSLYNSMKIVVPDLDKQHEFVKILKQSDKSKEIQYLDISSIDNSSKTVTGLTTSVAREWKMAQKPVMHQLFKKQSCSKRR